MNRYFIVILFVSFGVINAQKSLRYSVKGGINISHLSTQEGFFGGGVDTNFREFPSKTSFYLGGFFDLKLSNLYTLSPELLLSNQGSEYIFTENNIRRTGTINVSYLNLNIVNKFKFTEDFYPYVGTSFDFVVDKNYTIDSEIDFAFFIGAGINLSKNFGMEARIKKGIIPVLDYSNGNHDNVIIQLGGTYSFDVK